jgi:hypothetical protein
MALPGLPGILFSGGLVEVLTLSEGESPRVYTNFANRPSGIDRRIQRII